MGAFESFASDYGIISRSSAGDVVRFDGQHFLQGVGGAIAFQSPDLHFSKPLASALRLSSEWLLGDKRIRTDGPHMYLVLHHMVQLHHIDLADRHLLVKNSPVLPSQSLTLPSSGRPAFLSSSLISSSVAPWKPGVIA